MKNQPESTGLPANIEQNRQRPLSTSWITDELMEDTRKVWSKVYGRVISPAEAVEILMNVKKLAEVIMDAQQKGEGS